jgi:hypothetical protein
MSPCLLLPPVVAAYLVAGCGSERFDPTTVSLTGTWKLAEVTDPAPPVEGSRCFVQDVPLNLEEIEGGEWIGFSQPGGTRRCQQPGGSFGPPTSYDPEYILVVRKNGERITAISATSRAARLHRQAYRCGCDEWGRVTRNWGPARHLVCSAGVVSAVTHGSLTGECH